MTNLNNPLVSIIVPVYNIEPYIKRCVRSIINQTYNNLEIILVNDGSQDSCPAICDAFAIEDKRIFVIHQDNKGLGAARNAGLDLFKGQWCCFIDGDDWVEPNYVEALLNSAVENDCLIASCAYKEVFSEQESQLIPNLKIVLLDWRNYLFFTFSTNGYNPHSSVLSIYNRKLLEGFKFSLIVLSEDVASVYSLIYACGVLNSHIAVLNLCLYNYFQRDNSLSRGKKDYKWFSGIEAFDAPLEFFRGTKEHELYDFYWFDYFDRCIEVACECSKDIPQYKTEIDSIVKRIQKGTEKAYEMPHPSLQLSLSARSNWQKLQTDSRFVLYGYGKNGKRYLEWLLYFNIPIVEIWDNFAVKDYVIDGIPIKQMHPRYINGDVVILNSLGESNAMSQVSYNLRILGYQKIIRYAALDNAIKFAKYRAFLPFLLEDDR